MRRAATALVVLTLVAAACGSDERSADTSSTTTTAAPVTTTTSTSTTTTSTTTTLPPATPFPARPSFSLQPGPADWESTYIDPGAIVQHDGEWHMFYNGIDSWPAPVKVGYATSPDGLTWTKQATEPVFVTSEIPYAAVSAFMSDAEVLDDGTWAIWFFTVESSLNFNRGVIGRITAPGPMGPWTPDAEPSLDRGPEGSWYSLGVNNPTVARIGDEWWMWFDGSRGDLDSEGDRGIGLATSTDGEAWVLYDDPATTDEPFSQSDPVLMTTPDAWDERRLYDPGVVGVDGGLAMTYFTRRPGTSSPLY